MSTQNTEKKLKWKIFVKYLISYNYCPKITGGLGNKGSTRAIILNTVCEVFSDVWRVLQPPSADRHPQAGWTRTLCIHSYQRPTPHTCTLQLPIVFGCIEGSSPRCEKSGGGHGKDHKPLCPSLAPLAAASRPGLNITPLRGQWWKQGFTTANSIRVLFAAL